MARNRSYVVTEEIIDSIISMSKEGYPIRLMTSELNIPASAIMRIREELINNNRLTEEEIKKGRRNWKTMYPPSLGGFEQKKKRKTSNKKSQNNQNRKILKDEVVILVKEGKTFPQISKELKTPRSTLKFYISELIREGRIDKNDINFDGQRNKIEIDPDLIDPDSEQFKSTIDSFLKYLREGYSNKAIQKKLSITPYEFSIYLKYLKDNKKITAEEIEKSRNLKHSQDLEYIAKKVKEGYTLAEIYKSKEGILNPYTVKKELIASGMVSEDDFKKIHSEVRSDNNKNEVPKMTRDEKIEFVRELSLKGYSYEEIIAMNPTNTITYNFIAMQRKKMIIEGVITKAELRKRTLQHKNELKSQEMADENDQNIINRNSEEFQSKLDTFLEYLRKGYHYSIIQNKLNITHSDYKIYLQYVIENNLITSKEIDQNRELRKKEDLKVVEERIKKGDTLAQIGADGFMNANYLARKLIEQGIITKEQIQQNLRTSKSKFKRKKTTIPYEEKTEFIRNLVLQGYTTKEIIALDPTQSITLNKVSYQIKLMRQEGLITEEELKEKRKQHRKELRAKNHKKRETKIDERKEFVKNLILQGYSYSEIIDIAMQNDLNNINSYYINNQTRIMFKEGIITKEELKERKKRHKDEKGNPTNKVKTNSIDTTSKEVQDEIDKLLEYLKIGYKPTIIQEKLNISASKYNQYLRYLYKEEIITAEEVEENQKNKHLRDLNTIARLIKSGKTLSQIAKETGLKNIYVLKSELIERGLVSEDEIQNNAKNSKAEKKHRALEEKFKDQSETVRGLILEGLLPSEIIKSNLTEGINLSYVNYLTNRLIVEGIITEEELQERREQNKKELRAKNQKKRETKIDERKEFVKNLILQGYSYSEIIDIAMQNDLNNINSYYINNQTRIMFKEGIITKEELQERRKKHKEEISSQANKVNPNPIDTTSKEFQDEVNKLLEYLKIGYKPTIIQEKLNISASKYNQYLRYLYKEEIITAEEVEENQKNKHLQDLNTIAELIKSGKTLAQIAREKGIKNIYTLKSELLKLKLISEDEITNNANKFRREMRKNAFEEKYNYQSDTVRGLILAGYSPAEVIKSDSTEGIDLSYVNYQTNKLIAEGIITKEELKARRERHEAAKKKKGIENSGKGPIHNEESQSKSNEVQTPEKNQTEPIKKAPKVKRRIPAQSTNRTISNPNTSPTTGKKDIHGENITPKSKVWKIKNNYEILCNKNRQPAMPIAMPSDNMKELLIEFSKEDPDIEHMQELIHIEKERLKTNNSSSIISSIRLDSSGIEGAIYSKLHSFLKKRSIRDPKKTFSILQQLFPEAEALSHINLIVASLSNQDREDEAIRLCTPDIYGPLMSKSEKNTVQFAQEVRKIQKRMIGLKIGKMITAQITSDEQVKMISDDMFIESLEKTMQNNGISKEQILLPISGSSKTISLSSIWYDQNANEKIFKN